MTLKQPVNSLLLFSSTPKPPFLMEDENVSPHKKDWEKKNRKQLKDLEQNPTRKKKKEKSPSWQEVKGM